MACRQKLVEVNGGGGARDLRQYCLPSKQSVDHAVNNTTLVQVYTYSLLHAEEMLSLQINFKSIGVSHCDSNAVVAYNSSFGNVQSFVAHRKLLNSFQNNLDTLPRWL